MTSGTSTPTLFTLCFLGATFPVSSCINSHHAHRIHPQIGLSLAGIPIKPTLAPSMLICPHNTIPSPTTKFGYSWEELTTSFLSDHDPSRIVDFIYSSIPKPTNTHFETPQATLSQSYPTGLLARLHVLFYPHCLTSVMTQSPPLIVDTGASVCITPNKGDFIASTYRPSSLKIKDLSSSNKVLGEGMIH